MIELNKIYFKDCLEGIIGIEDKSIDMILSDLPYTFEGKQRVTANKWDTPINQDILWEHYLRVIKDCGAIVLTATNPFASYLINKHIDYFKYEWVWEKDNGSNFVHVKTQPFRVHELVLVFGKSPTTYNKSGRNMTYNPQFTFGTPYKVIRDMSNVENLEGFKGRTNTDNADGKRYPRTVFKFNLERGLHPTQKPVKLFEYLIKTYTNVGDIVLDTCIGSGTTAIACLQTDRKFIGFENNQKYYEIAIKRVERFIPLPDYL
jgi:site-specific DNA-methyltransferase (adenine-specific)